MVSIDPPVAFRPHAESIVTSATPLSLTREVTPLGFSIPSTHLRHAGYRYNERRRLQGLITLLTYSPSHTLRIVFQIRAFMGFTLQSFIPHKDSHLFQGPYSLTVILNNPIIKTELVHSVSEFYTLCEALNFILRLLTTT